MDDALQAEREAAIARVMEAQMMSKPLLRKTVLFMADDLMSKGVIAINALSWDMSGNKEEQTALLHVGFLFKNYEVSRWYFEIIEMVRKLLMTSVLVIISPGTVSTASRRLHAGVLFPHDFSANPPIPPTCALNECRCGLSPTSVSPSSMGST